MNEERMVRMMIIFDPNSADSIEMAHALNPSDDIGKVEVQKVRKFFPEIRATPAVGVMMWASDLQGIVQSVDAFKAYIEGEAEVKESAHLMQRYIPDEVAFAAPRVLYDAWNGDGVAYELNDIRKYGEREELYRCIMAHTSQADWTPDTAVSLWVRIADPAQEYPEWIQPLGAHDAYAKGAKVSHNDKHWTSDIDNNTYEPGVYGWTEVSE